MREPLVSFDTENGHAPPDRFSYLPQRSIILCDARAAGQKNSLLV
jgi:hypothetical protein